MRVGKHKVQKETGSTLLELVLRSEVEKVTFELNRCTRDSMLHIPARVSGICAAGSDQAVVFRLLTQESYKRWKGWRAGPGA